MVGKIVVQYNPSHAICERSVEKMQDLEKNYVRLQLTNGPCLSMLSNALVNLYYCTTGHRGLPGCHQRCRGRSRLERQDGRHHQQLGGAVPIRGEVHARW